MIGVATYGLVIALLAFGTLRAPARGLSAVLCLYGIKQWGQSSTSWLAAHSPATNIAIGLLVLTGILLRAVRGKCILCRMPPVGILVLALFCYALCTISWTPDPQNSLHQWQLQGPYLLTVIVLAPLLIEELDDFRNALQWTALVGGLLCGLALVFGKWGSRGLLVFGDLYEQQTNPLAIASMAGTVFVAALLSLQKYNHLLKRFLFLAVIPLAVAVILRSGSRGQLVAAFAAVLLAWPIAYPQKNLGSFVLWAATSAVIALAAVKGVEFLQTDAARWSGQGSSEDVAERLGMGFSLLTQAASSPFSLLFGLGNSSAFYYVGFYPHVTLLEVIGEEGLVGLLLYSMILWMGGRSIIRLLRSGNASRSRSDRNALAILAAAFMFELLLTFKQGSLLSSTYVFAYVILLGKLEQPTGAAASEPAAASISEYSLRRFPNLMR